MKLNIDFVRIVSKSETMRGLTVLVAFHVIKALRPCLIK